MKFALATIAYHEERLIRPFVRHYREMVDKILVLNSTVPWNGPLEDYDCTADFAKAEGAQVFKHHWPSEHSQRNAGLTVLSDYDWVFILDPDEFFSKEDFEKLKLWIEEDSKKWTFKNAYCVPLETYWKGAYKLVPRDTHCPVIAVNPKASAAMFNDKRGLATEAYDAPFLLHHFSWVRTDEEVFRKLTHYGHAGDFNGVEWYNKIWLKWYPEMKNLHPFDTKKWVETVPCKIPKELEHLLILE